MPLNLVASGTVPKGFWSQAFSTTATNQEFVLRVPSVPLDRPVPAFAWAHRYFETLNVSEPVWVNILGVGERNIYGFINDSGSDIWIYHELRSPLANPLPWEIWLYS